MHVTFPADKVRQLCRAFAKEQIERQKADFIRLGVLGDWDNPYLTMNFKTEADIIRSLGQIYQNGYLYQGQKPVNWCIDCGSALAEAEVEYEDKVSPAIDVGFAVQLSNADTNLNLFNDAFGVSVAAETSIYVIIWTTTPWTLPANQAVSVHPDLEYALIQTPLGFLIVADELKQTCLQRYELSGETLATCKGQQLEHLVLHHPFESRTVPIICGKHVTLEAGTGLVHTAPAQSESKTVLSSANTVSIMMSVFGRDRFIFFTASIPEIPGRLMSIRITSGKSVSTFFTALSASENAPMQIN